MIHTYFSTFVTGFSNVVADNLPKHINVSKIDLLLDGLIVYTTNVDIKQIRKLNYLNNTFALLKLFDRKNRKSVDQMLESVLADNSINESISSYVHNKKSFRIIISKENQLISANKKLVRKLEEKISENANLTPDRSLSDIEFWLLMRSEGEAFFCMRLTKNPNQEKYLEKGELRPELASILCLMSDPGNKDIFLDPFCGYGSIPIQRLLIPKIRYEEIIALDNKPELTGRLRHKIDKFRETKKIGKFTIKESDSLRMSSLEDNSVTKIVTDPPWGLRASKLDDISKFQNDMIHELYRVLAKEGILVILIKKDVFDETLQKNRDKFKLIKEYTTLVSGQKASAYKLQVIK